MINFRKYLNKFFKIENDDILSVFEDLSSFHERFLKIALNSIAN